MRMAELSARSGAAIPTIRFYIREGLLPAGELTSPNQASYDEGHVRTLRLIRALVEIGGFSISRVREVLAFVDAKEADLYATMGGVQYALTDPGGDIDVEATGWVDDLLGRQGWEVREDNPARVSLAQALARLARLDQPDVLAQLEDYARAAHELAEREVDALLRRESVEAVAEGVVAYDVLGDAVLSALRRMAQEDVLTRRLRG